VLLASPNESAKRLTEQFKDLLDPGIRPPLNANGAWLVRPDGYVACVAANDIQVIADYLSAVGRGASVPR
jgi:hypothetical protein